MPSADGDIESNWKRRERCVPRANTIATLQPFACIGSCFHASRQGSELGDICKRAYGMGDGFFDTAKQLASFVKVWSGGVDGHCLKELDAYERTLKVKRKLYAKDLELISRIDFLDGPKYVNNSGACESHVEFARGGRRWSLHFVYSK